MYKKIDLSADLATIIGQIEPLYENSDTIKIEAVNKLSNENFIDVYNYFESLIQFDVKIELKVKDDVPFSFLALINAGINLVTDNNSKVTDELDLLGKGKDFMLSTITKAKNKQGFGGSDLDWANSVI